MLDVERVRDTEEVLRLVLDAMQGRIWTAMPGIVEAFQADQNTVSVQVAIKGKVRALDASGARTGEFEDVAIPLLVDCPVVFPQGGGFALTFPIAAGDEVLCVFAARCIDAWWESGQVSTQAEFRMHSLSDGFAIPGVRSKPRALPDVSPDAVQLRTASGAVFVEVSAAGVKIKGALEVEGDTMFTGAVTANGVCIDDTHLHDYDDAGSPATTMPPRCP